MTQDATEVKKPPSDNCDAKQPSRKGRPAINGQTMTAADRKRRQRERERTEQHAIPSWLRLRQRVWALMQEQFMFANANELSEALRCVSIAIAYANIFGSDFPPETITKALRALLDPSSADRGLLTQFPELAPYATPDVKEFPGITDRRLLDVLRDILGESQNIATVERELDREGDQ